MALINVSGNCGCTIAHFPKEAIAPKAKDSILVEYTGAKEAGGSFIKTVTVQSNASNGTQSLNIKGELIP